MNSTLNSQLSTLNRAKPAQLSTLNSQLGKARSTLNSQLSTLNSFARVKGSGTFHLDEFCAVTGMEPRRAIRCLVKGEKLGLLLRLGELFLLYPPPPVSRKIWHDWKFDTTKQRMIFDACKVNPHTSSHRVETASSRSKMRQDEAPPIGISQPELREKLNFSKTLLQRYLTAMTRAGVLIAKRNGGVNLYRQGTWRELTTYRQEKASTNNSQLSTLNWAKPFNSQLSTLNWAKPFNSQLSTLNSKL